MRLLMILLLSIHSALAGDPANTVINYLRETPAFVSGRVVLAEEMEVYRTSKGPINIKMIAGSDEGIGFSFSEKHLGIHSGGGLTLNIQGIPISIKSIEYYDSTGKFHVNTETPLGIGEDSLEGYIEETLNEHYKPKVIEAFQKLKSLREKKNLKDIKEVVSAISEIFSNGKDGPPLPELAGEISLNFRPEEDQQLKIDKWNANLLADDQISAKVNFKKNKDEVKLRALSFSSQKGIRISGQTPFPEISSLNFKELKADEMGISFHYDLGAEEVLTGFRMVIAMVGAYNGNPELAIHNCDPVTIQSIRENLDENLKREISKMIRSHRQTLLNGGVSSDLLAALE